MWKGCHIHPWKLALWQVKVAMYRFPLTEMKLHVFWLELLLGSEDTGNLVMSDAVRYHLEHGKGNMHCTGAGSLWYPGSAPGTREHELCHMWLQAIWAKIDPPGSGMHSQFPRAVECMEGEREGSLLATLSYAFEHQDLFSKVIFLHASRYLNNAT